MQNLADGLDKLETDAVEARENYIVAYADAFLHTTGPMDVRKQAALLETSDARLAAEVGEAKVQAARGQISALKVRIDVGRSASALVRAEADLLGVRR